jgi:hypothetical protein
MLQPPYPASCKNQPLLFDQLDSWVLQDADVAPEVLSNALDDSLSVRKICAHYGVDNRGSSGDRGESRLVGGGCCFREVRRRRMIPSDSVVDLCRREVRSGVVWIQTWCWVCQRRSKNLRWCLLRGRGRLESLPGRHIGQNSCCSCSCGCSGNRGDCLQLGVTNSGLARARRFFWGTRAERPSCSAALLRLKLMVMRPRRRKSVLLSSVSQGRACETVDKWLTACGLCRLRRARARAHLVARASRVLSFEITRSKYDDFEPCGSIHSCFRDPDRSKKGRS